MPTRRTNYKAMCSVCGDEIKIKPGDWIPQTCSDECLTEARRQNMRDWHADRGNRVWTPESVVQSLMRFYDKHGVSPTNNQSRQKQHNLPADTQVITLFGSWNMALKAAGLPIRSPGWTSESHKRVKKWGNDRNLKKVRVKCHQCGKTFWAWRRTAMYCSNACNCKAYHKRKVKG